jgi:hypothetical protein
MSVLQMSYDESVSSTPWGPAQGIKIIDFGITNVSTAGHGGIKLSFERNEKMPEYMRNSSGWYEEDAEWAKVAVVFPQSFDSKTVDAAIDTFRNWHPDAWERFFEQQLQPGQSYIRDQETFTRDTANALVVTTAFGSWAKWVPETFVGCVAYVGGRDRRGGTKGEARYFLVPEAEYGARSGHGFVIEPDRHKEILSPFKDEL